MIALAQFHQDRSEQRPLFEVEWSPRRLASDSHRFSVTFEFRDILQICDRQLEASVRGMNHLHRLALPQFESGSPDFMAPDKFSKGPFQRGHIQRA